MAHYKQFTAVSKGEQTFNVVEDQCGQPTIVVFKQMGQVALRQLRQINRAQRHVGGLKPLNHRGHRGGRGNRGQYLRRPTVARDRQDIDRGVDHLEIDHVLELPAQDLGAFLRRPAGEIGRVGLQQLVASVREQGGAAPATQLQRLVQAFQGPRQVAVKLKGLGDLHDRHALTRPLYPNRVHAPLGRHNRQPAITQFSFGK